MAHSEAKAPGVFGPRVLFPGRALDPLAQDRETMFPGTAYYLPLHEGARINGSFHLGSPLCSVSFKKKLNILMAWDKTTLSLDCPMHLCTKTKLSLDW